MSADELFDSADCFTLQSETSFVPPSLQARAADLAAEVASQPPPPPAPPRPIFRLSAAELAKIDRNMARLSKLTDRTGAMF